jgi:hypothetical protein
MRYLLGFLYFTIIHNSVYSQVPEVLPSRDSLRSEYVELHKKYFKKFCSRGEEHRFWELYKKYRGDGHYIPSLEDDSIDIETIKKYLPVIEEKIKWLDEQITYLDSLKYVRRKRHVINDYRRRVYRLLEYKYQFEKFRKFRTIGKSKKELRALSKEFSEFLKSVRFLLPFRYPTNFLELRDRYDQLKEVSKKESNDVYFYRKIVEEGALNPEETGSDFHLRGLLGSLFFSLNENRSFINENLRFDLMSVFDFLENSLQRGKVYHLAALKRWKRKTSESLNFYRKLIAKDSLSSKKYLDKKYAAEELKNFVNQNHYKVYKFWSEQSEAMQAIFTLETILFNEVGNFDGPGNPESHDVAKVVKNRLYRTEYNTFLDDDPLKKYILTKESDFKFNSKWLNLMFKKGEFSFTFFYIPGNVKTYCPDMSRAGKNLRKRNIEISLDTLFDKENSFEGIRYFSRSSMTGRIDMASLWRNFYPLPEKPGLEIRNYNNLLRAFKKKQFRYYYTFTDNKKNKYDVLELNSKVYVMQLGTGKFYHYRNPHFFRFFADKI